MKQAQQIEILKELIGQIDNQRNIDAGRILANPTSAYTDPALAEREWEAFFQHHPQVLGLSGELPQPGSYITSDDFGVVSIAS